MDKYYWRKWSARRTTSRDFPTLYYYKGSKMLLTDKGIELIPTTNTERIEFFRIKFPDVTKEVETNLLKTLELDKLTVKEKRMMSGYLGKTPSQIDKLIDTTIKQNKIIDELNVLPDTHYEFVEAYIAKYQLEMHFNEMFTNHAPIKYEGKIIDIETLNKLDEKTRHMVTGKHVKMLTKSLLLQDLMHCAANLKLEYKDKDIDAALNFYMTKKKQEIEGNIINRIIDNKPIPCEKLWDDLVSNITDVNHTETKVMMKHFIWQVKRKMMGLPVDYHNMLVLFGSFHGTGKSVFMSRFVEPIADVTANASFEILSDDRYFNFFHHYVLTFDEMSKAESSDIENVKRAITSNTLTVKPLYGNKLENIVNKATMIGTSNKDLSQIINDNTGMRRFYQIDCKPVFDHDFINKFDYKKLWKSIDHNKPSPFTQDVKVQVNIKELQNAKRQKSDIEQFLETYHSKDKISSKALYIDFKEWLQEFNPAFAARYSIRLFNVRLETEAKYVKGLTLTKLNKKKDGYETFKIEKNIDSHDD